MRKSRPLILLASIVIVSTAALPLRAAAEAGGGAFEVNAPIVFAHGVGIRSEAYEYLIPMARAFEKLGYRLLVARTPANGSLEERAAVLHGEIQRLVPEGPFHLLGHSMGGLDARLAIQRYDLGRRCLSLTTLATPHQGSVVADYLLEKLEAGEIAFRPLRRLLNWLESDLHALRQLTTSYVGGEFNREVIDDPRVRYFSVGFYIPEPILLYTSIPYLIWANRINSAAGYPLNDGPVTLESAGWGEPLGDYPGDHYSETAPIPFGGKFIYRETFGIVTDNLNRAFD